MMYQGGKSRIAKQLAIIMLNVTKSLRERESNCFVSLFCGSCSVESKITGFDKVILNDKHKYLIEMFKGVQNGYELPEYISEEDYKYIRSHKDEDKVLTGFVGFGCSFGGKWFGGYARNKRGTNYAKRSKHSLLKDMKTLQDAEFLCNDYREVEIPDNAVVYCDPPYNNTTGYNNEKFDSDSFWNYMRELSQNHLVFISEQEAPIDFIPIWEKAVIRTLNKNNQFKKTEKLFVHKCNAEIISKVKNDNQ